MKWFILLIVGLLASCELTDDAVEGTNAESVSTETFNVEATAVSSEDLEWELAEHEGFYNYYPNSYDQYEGDADLEDCFYSMLDSIPWTTDKDGFHIIDLKNVDVSTQECGEGLDKLVMSAYFKIKGVDENGNSIHPEDGSAYPDKIYSLLKINMAMETKEQFDQITTKIKGNASFMVAATNNANQPCEGSDTFLTNCSESSLLKIETSSTGLESLGPQDRAEAEAFLNGTQTQKAILHAVNLNMTEYGTFFTGGYIDFEIQDWKGRVNYHESNPEARPTYTASNGQVEVSGTFPDYSYYNKGSFKKAIAKTLADRAQQSVTQLKKAATPF